MTTFYTQVPDPKPSSTSAPTRVLSSPGTALFIHLSGFLIGLIGLWIAIAVLDKGDGPALAALSISMLIVAWIWSLVLAIRLFYRGTSDWKLKALLLLHFFEFMASSLLIWLPLFGGHIPAESILGFPFDCGAPTFMLAGALALLLTLPVIIWRHRRSKRRALAEIGGVWTGSQRIRLVLCWLLGLTLPVMLVASFLILPLNGILWSSVHYSPVAYQNSWMAWPSETLPRPYKTGLVNLLITLKEKSYSDALSIAIELDWPTPDQLMDIAGMSGSGLETDNATARLFERQPVSLLPRSMRILRGEEKPTGYQFDVACVIAANQHSVDTFKQWLEKNTFELSAPYQAHLAAMGCQIDSKHHAVALEWTLKSKIFNTFLLQSLLRAAPLDHKLAVARRMLNDNNPQLKSLLCTGLLTFYDLTPHDRVNIAIGIIESGDREACLQFFSGFGYVGEKELKRFKLTLLELLSSDDKEMRRACAFFMINEFGLKTKVPQAWDPKLLILTPLGNGWTSTDEDYLEAIRVELQNLN